MKKLALILALSACGIAQAQTAAPSPLYGEIGYAALNTEVIDADFDTGAIRAILGYELHPNVAIEAMLGFGVGDDSFTNRGDTVKLKIKNSYGLFLKPKVQIVEGLEAFGRIGYARSKLKATLVGYSSETDSDSDVAYGAGLSYQFTKSVYGSVDYMRYYNEDDTKVDGFTFAVGYRF